jgi:AcrR family transcriptional regulator/DNA-binding MarR family transcriptional regulator
MVGATVNDALAGRIAALDGDPGRREAVALGLVDAVLTGDDETLAAALNALRDARAHADGGLAGWLDAAIAFAHWGLERAPSRGAVAPGTQAHDFLRALDDAPQSGSTDLRRLLEVDETQVSRTGRRLLESGLVTRRKVGREVFWQLTPRGERALAEAPSATQAPNADFWQEAIRRGFDRAYGDQPGAREVDPTSERIVECTLALHARQGIQATTRAEIARKAGVPLETVQGVFPTQDDLYRRCGEHLLESLRVPPIDRAPDVFAGAATEHERVHRLVETLFSAYERGAGGITVGRRERKEVPVVDEVLEQLDLTFDALVVEAFRPHHTDSASVASLRALTDLEVWRTLREHGDPPDTAVDQASAAVERWLEARP